MKLLSELAVLRDAGHLEVEDILRAAALGSAKDVPALRAFVAELPQTNVPMRQWMAVVCAFLEGGYAAVVEHALEPDGLAFALGLLEELHSAEAVITLSAIVRRDSNIAHEERFATTTNLLLSFNPPRGVPQADTKAIREALHSALQSAFQNGASEVHVATLLYATRGVGNEETVELIRGCRPLEAPHENAPQAAIKAISGRAS
jgi:hypothetical protein